MLFIYRLILNILSFICIQLPLQAVGCVVLLFLCPFCRIGGLPRAFRWFDSADPFVGRDTSVIDVINAQPERSPYFWRNGFLTRYNWLAFRNPINYFAYKHLGFQFQGNEFYQIQGSLNVGDSTGRQEGLKIIELSNGKYEYLYVKRIGEKACFYFRIGYKIVDTTNQAGEYCQQVFTISYRSYSGI
jgi:hypothetical protein